MKAVIFDMDGVLVDTESVKMQQLYDLFLAHNFKVEREDIYSIIGTANDVTWKMLGKMVDPQMTEKEVIELCEANIDNSNLNFYDLKFPHVQSIFKLLKRKNVKTAIASNSSTDDIEKVIKQTNLVDHVDYYLSGRSLPEAKPNPAIYLRVMEELGVSKGKKVIIEDSYSGIQAGKRTDAFVIAIKDHKFGIDQSEADLIVEDLLEAYNYIVEYLEL